MIYETLTKSALKNELILVDNGYCRYHIRRDNQLTIYEILVLPKFRGRGIGSGILKMLEEFDVSSIFARCPVDLPSNEWYINRGFILDGTETTGSGRGLNLWRKMLG